jgi:hypothetical protein
MSRAWFGALGIVGAVAFAAGRASVQGVDDQVTRDSLGAYRRDASAWASERAALADSIRRSVARVAVLDTIRRQLLAVIATEHRRGLQLRTRADSLDQQLASARTAADSLPLLVQACEARREECASLRSERDSLERVVASDSSTRGELEGTIGRLRRGWAGDSVSMEQARGLIGRLERRVRGCRMPVVDIRCPAAILAYDMVDGQLLAGAGIPVKRWLTISIVGRVYRP